MKRLRSPILVSVLTLTPIALLAAAPAARADIPPTCDMEASLITCAAADVGKPCQGAGQCYAVSCLATTPSTTTATEYKCDACPTVVTTSSVTCSTTNVGTACGTGATCTVLSAWCAAAGGSKYVCAMPAAAQPTGPPTGETGAAGGGGASSSGAAGGGGASTTGTGGASTSSGDGGCTIGAGTETTAGIAGVLIVIGLGFLSLSRRRRPR